MQDAGKNTFCHEYYFIFDIVFGSLYNRQHGRERFARGITIVPYPTINKPMPSITMH
ncbi:DEHA2E09438p [Debaryomyces hansenii CBS767]|uniref:DEHA2E09438p n=1 Tax=Debaryomyces hansenii (strain ATCC 36239 / CBS 767 / BCRC 21394 / JCM 1990 / NBRC 0083 / IGC 2968) TaxID=284592 RepID=B5RTY4_DEBHA|nr:DEHA2E09438p [Debaryomyces hansenii CBS767]CAR65796.1 DEHA2E09438p [Debaryomyces hansenii CBS767]|eukprot:XP_002770453.1 DEHA2E09438p [Debaryomyces hansenii CBS767]